MKFTSHSVWIFIYLQNNTAVLLNKQGNPIGTRILGPIPRKLKKKKVYENYKFIYRNYLKIN